MKTKQKVLISMSAALLAVISQIAIPVPFSAVPLTFQLSAITLLSIVLPNKSCIISTCIYILLGAIGLPVFSGFSSGFSALLGPTGGYIIGFIFMSLFVSLGAQTSNLKLLYLFSSIGLILDYIFGTLQLKFSLGISFYEAFLTGVMPFIIKDIILVYISISIGYTIKKSLINNNLLF